MLELSNQRLQCGIYCTDYDCFICRLFLVSSKFSTELPSDTCTRTGIINFSATLEGYQDQLLSATINIVCVAS